VRTHLKTLGLTRKASKLLDRGQRWGLRAEVSFGFLGKPGGFNQEEKRIELNSSERVAYMGKRSSPRKRD